MPKPWWAVLPDSSGTRGLCRRGRPNTQREQAVLESFSPGRRKNLGWSQKGRGEGRTSALPGRQLGLRAPAGPFGQAVPHGHWQAGEGGKVGTEVGLALMDPVESFDCTAFSSSPVSARAF